MRIGILICGRPPEELSDRFKSYDLMFQDLLAGRGFSFASYAALDGILPDAVDECEGWLITGSKFGAYEEHAWIPPLEDFLRRAYAAAVPIVGICFGHQILAQALGGKVVKFDGGWSLGVQSYDLDELGPARVIAWHQDQVVEKPAEAEVVGASAFCKYAALSYGKRAYTIQPHPEFLPDYVLALLQARRAILPQDRAEAALASLDQALSTGLVADKIERVFKEAA